MPARRVLSIGVDGGTWALLEPAINAGFMPYLGSLIEQGVSGPLHSTTPPKTPAAWGSFQTGQNPGKTGVYDFSSWDRETREHMPVSSLSLPETIWEIASEAGKRVAAINVPMTYPPRPVNGYIVTGVLTPSVKADFTYPATLRNELLAAVPGYRILNLRNMRDGSPHRDLRTFVEQMRDVLDKRADAAEHVLAMGPFELFMVHFQATDVVQHTLWGYMDERHPLYAPEKRAYVFDRFYRRLDQRMQRICATFMERYEGDTLVLVMSDHGFQTHIKRFHLGNWLRQEGFLVIDESSTYHPPSAALAAADLLRRLDFLNLRKRVRGRLREKTISMLRSTAEVDWRRSRVLSFSRSDAGLLFLLEDDPRQQEKTSRELQERLGRLVDQERGVKIVAEILPREEIYHGAKIDRMPDLIVRPAAGYSFTGNYLPDAEDLFHVVTPREDFHVGMHHMQGIFLAAGDHVRRGDVIEDARLIDMAPTILYYLNIPISESMDGRVLRELFQKDFELNYQPGRASESDRRKDVYSTEEAQQLEERLKALGYL